MLVWLLQRSEPTPHDNGGKQRLFRTGILARKLVRSGHKIVWWTSTFDHYGKRQRVALNKRIKVDDNYHIQYMKGFGYKKNFSFARLKENLEIAKQFSLLALKDSQKPDVIVASIPTAELAKEALLYAKKRSIPVIIDVRDLWPDFIIGSFPKFLRPIAKMCMLPLAINTEWVFRNADAVIAITNEFLDWGLNLAGRQRTQFDRVFHMGYERRSLDKNEKQAGGTFWLKHGLGCETKFLLNVIFIGAMGRTSELFGVYQAARMINSLNIPIRFILCGDGEQYPSLKAKCASLENVIMPGWIDDVQIRFLLANADIGVAPYINSPNYTMNLPNKPAEYFSAGLAIATSLKTGPLVNLINTHKCGFSYHDNPNLLVENLIYYTNEGRLKEAKKNATHVFKTYFDGDKIYSDMADFIKQVAGSVKSKSDINASI